MFLNKRDLCVCIILAMLYAFCACTCSCHCTMTHRWISVGYDSQQPSISRPSHTLAPYTRMNYAKEGWHAHMAGSLSAILLLSATDPACPAICFSRFQAATTLQCPVKHCLLFKGICVSQHGTSTHATRPIWPKHRKQTWSTHPRYHSQASLAEVSV